MTVLDTLPTLGTLHTLACFGSTWWFVCLEYKHITFCQNIQLMQHCLWGYSIHAALSIWIFNLCSTVCGNIQLTQHWLWDIQLWCLAKLLIICIMFDNQSIVVTGIQLELNNAMCQLNMHSSLLLYRVTRNCKMEKRGIPLCGNRSDW